MRQLMIYYGAQEKSITSQERYAVSQWGFLIKQEGLEFQNLSIQELKTYMEVLSLISVSFAAWQLTFPLSWNDNSSPDRPAMTGLMIKRFSLQSSLSFLPQLIVTLISCSWGEIQRPDTTRETNCYYVLWRGEEQKARGVQDDLFSLQQSITPVFSVLCCL